MHPMHSRRRLAPATSQFVRLGTDRQKDRNRSEQVGHVFMFRKVLSLLTNPPTDSAFLSRDTACALLLTENIFSSREDLLRRSGGAKNK